MPIRRNRIACQGVTNQSQASLNTWKSASIQNLKLSEKTKSLISSQPMMTSSLVEAKSKYDVPNLSATSQANFMKNSSQGPSVQAENQKNTHTKNNTDDTNFRQLLYSKSSKSVARKPSVQKLSKLDPKLEKTLQQMRSMYRYNANVRKIIKAWGFDNKGYISDDKFYQMVSKHFDPSITKQDCQTFFSSISSHNQNLDLLSFIKLVFDQEPFTKPHINVFDQYQNQSRGVVQQGQDPTKSLVGKIKDLNEGCLHENLHEHKKAQYLLPHLKVNDENKKGSNSFILQRKPSEDNLTQPSLYQTLYSSPNPRFNFSTTKSHGVEFTPTMFYGKNQQKTRFSATPVLQLNDQSAQENKRAKIVDQKDKIVQQIQKQRMTQKTRYQNKLDRIRQHLQRQKQNIEAIDLKVQERDNANMRRIREENIAYNYVNFIHNDWK